jgi:rhomboid protease GluP
LQILSNLGYDGWKIERLSSGWYIAKKENRGLLFWDYRPNQPMTTLPIDTEVKKWEAFIFCPEGLSSRDLEQPVLKTIQSWFIDLQTGIVFPYPPNPKEKTLDWLLTYVNINQPLRHNNENQINETSKIRESSGFPQVKKFIPYVTFILAAINIIVSI